MSAAVASFIAHTILAAAFLALVGGVLAFVYGMEGWIGVGSLVALVSVVWAVWYLDSRDSPGSWEP